MLLQTDRMGDVVELFATDFVQFFAFGLKLFINFEGFFRHHFVRVLRATDEREVRPGRDPLMAIAIQPHPKHQSFGQLSFWLFRQLRHKSKLKSSSVKSSAGPH